MRVVNLRVSSMNLRFSSVTFRFLKRGNAILYFAISLPINYFLKCLHAFTTLQIIDI